MKTTLTNLDFDDLMMLDDGLRIGAEDGSLFNGANSQEEHAEISTRHDRLKRLLRAAFMRVQR